MQSPFPPAWMLSVRARRIVVRPLFRRLVALGVALVTGLTVSSMIREAERQREAWGRTRLVAVATRDLEPGEVIDGDSVQLRRLPEVAVAAFALRAVPDGSVVRHPVAAGEALVAERLAPEGLSGVAALVPEGHRAVSIPFTPGSAPPIRTGDEVDLLAVMPTVADVSGHDHDDAQARDSPPVTPLAERALVVDVTEQSVSVAVEAPEAPLVAYALTNGAVLVALAGP